jgi:hypothetical protein
MNGIETAAKNAIEKLFAVNRKGRFVVNYVKTVTKNGVAVVV